MLRGMLLVIVILATAQFSLGQISPVQVTANKGTIQLQVRQPAALDVVLEEFCKRTNTVCEGTANAGAASVSAGTIVGTWKEVVSKMLAGSRLNYVAGEPTAKKTGKLVIEQPLKGSSSAIPTAVPTTVVPAAPSKSQEQEPAASERGMSETSATENSSPDTSAGSIPASGTSGSPFPDSSGRVVAGSDQPPQSGPFPDSQGKPIPASTSPGGSPFPDAHGNVIPAKPGPTGNPFPPVGTLQPK